MMQFGWDNAAPATIVLVTADRDFAYGVSVLKMRHYRVVLVAPASVVVHESLRSQVSVSYDWDSEILGKRVVGGYPIELGTRPTPQLTIAPRGHSRPTSEASRLPTIPQMATPLTARPSGDSRNSSAFHSRDTSDDPLSERMEGSSSGHQTLRHYASSDPILESQRPKGKELAVESKGSSLLSPATYVSD